VTGSTYERLEEHSRKVGVPVATLVAALAEELETLTPEQVAALVERARAAW
jgi:hypothetical protein